MELLLRLLCLIVAFVGDVLNYHGMKAMFIDDDDWMLNVEFENVHANIQHLFEHLCYYCKILLYWYYVHTHLASNRLVLFEVPVNE